MNRLCIDGLVNDSSFSNQLLMYLKKEESTCTDVHRLSAIIDVNMGLLGAENDCQKVCVVGVWWHEPRSVQTVEVVSPRLIA